MYECKCSKKYEKKESYIAHLSWCGKIRTPRRKRVIKEKKTICTYCNEQFENGLKLGAHMTFCIKNPLREQTCKKLSISGKKKILSQSTKNKISESRRSFLEKNPEKVPYLLNHSSKESYPEKIFREALLKNNILGWTQAYQNGIYEYDFAFVDLKIDIEVDGGTHLTEKVKAIDKRRDEWSKERGWLVLRFSAKEVKTNLENCINILNKTLKLM